MKKQSESPCLTCSRVNPAADCENKQCRQWQSWFLDRWSLIHDYYEKYNREEEK